MFSDDWAAACAKALAASEGFREAARNWRGTILLRLSSELDPARARRVFLHLAEGDCHEARAASPEDEVLADYVLDGSLATWRDLLSGALAPLMAVLGGRLTLVKGSLIALIPHAGMARELVAAATRVDTGFPEG
jgi:putative sterol carrier protein